MRNHRRARLFLVLPALLAGPGCSAAGGEPEPRETPRGPRVVAPTGRPLDASCPATAPITQGVPASIITDPWDGRAYGEQDLWISLPVLPGPRDPAAGDGQMIKFGSFTLDDRGVPTEAKGAPKLTARRLDGTGRATGDTGGYATARDDTGRAFQFWPTGITLPSGGCWLMTETLGRTTIRFVVDAG